MKLQNNKIKYIILFVNNLKQFLCIRGNVKDVNPIEKLLFINGFGTKQSSQIHVAFEYIIFCHSLKKFIDNGTSVLNSLIVTNFTISKQRICCTQIICEKIQNKKKIFFSLHFFIFFFS